MGMAGYIMNNLIHKKVSVFVINVEYDCVGFKIPLKCLIRP